MKHRGDRRWHAGGDPAVLGWPACQQLVGEHRRRPDIGGGVGRLARRPGRVGVGVGGGRPPHRRHRLRHREATQPHPSVGRHHHVLGADISVDHPLGVSRLQSGEQVVGRRHRRRRRQRPVRHQAAERHPADQLEHQAGGALLGDDVVDRDHPGMVEVGEAAGGHSQALGHTGGRRQIRPQALQGHRLSRQSLAACPQRGDRGSRQQRGRLVIAQHRSLFGVTAHGGES